MASDKEIKNLKSLLDEGRLDLSLKELETVPVREITSLKRVSELDLASNRLVRLPDDFPTLTNLVAIDLSANQLRLLPENFGNLVNLEHLDLYKNKLETVPVSFRQLKRLSWLDLKSNPLNPNLLRVAGDCLDAKQCKSAATKVVQYMQKTYSEQERARQQKELQRQKQIEEAEAVAKADAEKDKLAKATEKKKEKQRKEAKSGDQNDDKHNMPTPDRNLKRPPLHQREATKDKRAHGSKSSLLSYVGRCFTWIFLFLFVLILTLAGFAGFLYVNCNSAGGEFIPKSRQLCHDLYMSLHTGRFATTWDFKASFEESRHRISTAIGNLAKSIVEFDYVMWKDATIAFFIAARNYVVESGIYLYTHGIAMIGPAMEQFVEYAKLGWAYTIWLAGEILQYVTHFAKWLAELISDVFNNFPAYWEKLKLIWKNMK